MSIHPDSGILHCNLYLVKKGKKCPHCGELETRKIPLPKDGKYGYA